MLERQAARWPTTVVKPSIGKRLKTVQLTWAGEFCTEHSLTPATYQCKHRPLAAFINKTMVSLVFLVVIFSGILRKAE